jgi:hypothetical protein
VYLDSSGTHEIDWNEPTSAEFEREALTIEIAELVGRLLNPPDALRVAFADISAAND